MYRGPSHAVTDILQHARELAQRQGGDRPEVCPGQVLLALVDDPDPYAREQLAEYCNVAALRERLAARLSRIDFAPAPPAVPYSTAIQEAIRLAQLEAEVEQASEVRPRHLFRGLFRLENAAWVVDPSLSVAHEAGINLLALKEQLLAAGTA